MDDFVIPAKTMEELEERTIRFLKIAEKHNLCFKRSKCDFNIEEIPILGMVIGKGQIQMEQEKIKAVKEWKTPIKVKDMESFLGFANFYRRFIQNFSHIAKLLNELKGKKEWKWEEELKEGNQYQPYPGEKENSGQKWMLQDIQLEEYFPKSKKGNRNPQHFYRGQCNQWNETTKFTTKNYQQQQKLWLNGDNICQIQQKHSKYGQNTKI